MGKGRCCLLIEVELLNCEETVAVEQDALESRRMRKGRCCLLIEGELLNREGTVVVEQDADRTCMSALLIQICMSRPLDVRHASSEAVGMRARVRDACPNSGGRLSCVLGTHPEFKGMRAQLAWRTLSGLLIQLRTASPRFLSTGGSKRGSFPPTFCSRPPPSVGHSRLLARASSQRAMWLPGLDPPPHLDGTLVGDFGFDPLGLGKDPEGLKWYVQAGLVHCRFAMAGVAGILVTDLLRVTGISKIPVWFEAGAVKFDFASTQALFIVQLLLMGSQAEEGTFLGLEAALEGLQPGYPGGPLFNPLGLAKDIDNAAELKLKEIKNGRLAMVAMLGFFVQANVTHVGPIDNLITHLSDPFKNTIIHTLFASASSRTVAKFLYLIPSILEMPGKDLTPGRTK
ncbi:hypothetical protein Cni_G09021 [Canna indica]|uniref:Chlorophyll a-b binding protein, chloroplastic n=1 Tax=Canna indica TaxID=4628 RepID=A0AAQ3K3V7_9LILI|nr:hypothetical protein Cni_G09021 [Canna indica]